MVSNKPEQEWLENRQLILASQSPRRRALLEDAGYQFKVIVANDRAESDIDVRGYSPFELVGVLATAKARDVASKLSQEDCQTDSRTRESDWIVIAADTVADIDGEVLGKPDCRNDALRMLKLLSGREHAVHTGVCLLDSNGKEFAEVATSRLVMDSLTAADLESYLSTNKWQGKAGAFGYQDGWDWLQVIDGEESNVVGLPLERLSKMLRNFAS